MPNIPNFRDLNIRGAINGTDNWLSMSEVWNLDTLENRLVEPELVNYAYYPEMFIVADDFCAR